MLLFPSQPVLIILNGIKLYSSSLLIFLFVEEVQLHSVKNLICSLIEFFALKYVQYLSSLRFDLPKNFDYLKEVP